MLRLAPFLFVLTTTLALAGCTSPLPTLEPTALPIATPADAVEYVPTSPMTPVKPTLAATPVPATSPTSIPAPPTMTEQTVAPVIPERTSTPTPAVTPVPTPQPTATPLPTPTPLPTFVPTPIPPPTSTPAPVAVAVAMPTSLKGVPRIQAPLFSYDNEPVYNGVLSLVSSQYGFVADFYRLLAEEDEGNLFYSPYSLYTALAVVFAGAGGTTAAQFHEVLNLGGDPDQFHRDLNSLDLTLLDHSVRPGEPGGEDAESLPILSVVNGLWVQDGLEVRPQFLNTVTANYGIALQQLDFTQSPEAAAIAINQWADEATHGKIKGAISRKSITDDTVLAVTNAVYFKGDWEDQFEENGHHRPALLSLERAGGPGADDVSRERL